MCFVHLWSQPALTARASAARPQCCLQVPPCGCFPGCSACGALGEQSCFLAGTTACCAHGTVPFCHASCQCPAAFPPLPGEVCHTGPRHHAWFPRWPGWQQPTSVKVCRVRAVHHSYGWMQTVTLSWPLPKPDGLGFNGAASQSA